jgi:hypothetical protein
MVKKLINVTFTARRETYPPVHINNVQLPNNFPKKKKKKKNNISGQKSQIGLDTKTYWLTDCQLQSNSDSDSDQ